MNHGIQDELLKIQAAASLKEKECEDLRCQLEQLRRENRQVASVLLPAALAELEVLKKATELNYNASAEEELQAKLNDALAAAESQRQHFCKQQELEASLPCKKLHRKKEKRTLPRKKAYAGLPTPIKEKETYWLRRTGEFPLPTQFFFLSSFLRRNQYSIRTTRWIWRLCCANLSSLPMSVLTKPVPQGLLLRALMITLPATVAVKLLEACGVCCLIDNSLGEGTCVVHTAGGSAVPGVFCDCR
eukprot:391893-Pelagomonas_calceolata.AAC.2